MRLWRTRWCSRATEARLLRRGPALEIVVEAIEDDAIELAALADELLQHRDPVTASDALGVHRHGQQAARSVVVGIPQLSGPDLEDLRRRPHPIAAVVARLEQRPVVERPVDRDLDQRPLGAERRAL